MSVVTHRGRVGDVIQWDALLQSGQEITTLIIFDATLDSLPASPLFKNLICVSFYACKMELACTDLWQTNATNLTFSDCTGLATVSIGSCVSTQYLTISKCDVTLISSLRGLVNLTMLDLQWLNITRLPDLPVGICRVRLDGLTRCEDDGQLHNLPALNEVVISQCPAFGSGGLIWRSSWFRAKTRCRTLTLLLASRWRVRRTRCLRPLPHIPAEIWKMICSFTY
jgi:hypothetical protein